MLFARLPQPRVLPLVPLIRLYTSQKSVQQDRQTTPYRQAYDNFKYPNTQTYPSRCDVVIIGGGGMGSASAYFLKKKAGNNLNVVVIERDFTYSKASTPLSSGCLRQQFTIPENMMMSRYGAEFLQSFKKDIDPDIDPNFKSNGNLSVTDEQGADRMIKIVELQNEIGVKSEILSVAKLKEQFPWINTENVALGTFGCTNEGWFDPWALLMGIRKKAQSLGVRYIEGEVVDFEHKQKDNYNTVDGIIYKTADNVTRTLSCNKCILTAGAYSGELAKKAKIGVGEGLLSTPLPIEPRKRFVFIVRSQGRNIPPVTAPLFIDMTKTYFRREGSGGNFICGRSPSPDKEPSIDNLDVDMDYFETDIWPILAHRVPAFESLKLIGAWAGFYEFNKFDCNGVVGKHPAYDNFYIAAGFSGHGIQKVPAIGRGMSELIVDGGFKSIDLSLLSFVRIIENRPIVELAIA